MGSNRCAKKNKPCTTLPAFTQAQSLLFLVVHSLSLVTLEKKSVELTDTFSLLDSPCVVTVLATIVVDDFLFFIYFLSTCYSS